MGIPRFLTSLFKEDGFDVKDLKEFLGDGIIELHLDRRQERAWVCHRCNGELGAQRGKYPVKLECKISPQRSHSISNVRDHAISRKRSHSISSEWSHLTSQCA